MDGWNEAVIRVILVKLEWSWPEVNKLCISSRQKKNETNILFTNFGKSCILLLEKTPSITTSRLRYFCIGVSWKGYHTTRNNAFQLS